MTLTRTSIKCFFLTLFITLLISASIFAQKINNDKGPGDPCNNMDFQSCDFTGWVLTQGMVDATPYSFITPVPTINWGSGSVIGFPPTVSTSLIADQHFIVSPGTDPNAPIQMTSPFSGSGCTAMLGDGMNDRRHAARMSQTFMVSSANANFSYNYAAVLEDPAGHSLGEKPFFMARIYDQNGNSITCAEYQATAGDGTPGWVNLGNLQYKDWSTITVPLQAYIGQNVTVEFTVGDCKQGGHAGYVYIEASCQSLQIIASDTIICAGAVTLNAPNPFNGAYLWSPGGQTTPSIGVNSPGLYSVDLISSAGCIVTLEVNIGGSSSMTSNFTATTVCVGTPTNFTDISSPSANITNWNWDFNNDGVVDDTTQNPSYIFSTSGIHPVKLSVYAAGTCASDTIINVLVEAPPVAAFNFNEVCVGNATVFINQSTTGGNIASFNWDFNGLGTSNNQNPSFTFSNDGVFPVTLIVNSNGCTDTLTQNINVNPLPQISFGQQAVGCAPLCVEFINNNTTISSGAINTYQWNFGDGAISNDQFPTYCFENYSRVASISYDISLTAISDKGCENTLTIPNMITVYPIPLADFIVTPEITDVYNKEITFIDQSEIASSWYWDFGDGATSGVSDPIHEYDASGTYITSLYIENEYGCKDTVRREIKINPSFAVWIPNVFTPDGDGINDYFFIDGFGFKEIDVKIYDRWGILLMHDSGKKENVSWDGLYNGSMVQEDVYVYVVKVKDVLNEYHNYRGRVTLIK
ncbi:MAG: PKD domain-containing protein [Flavobacteriales bacterium]|nr:PKD domain-containing protein [Flavobacteriales bacterium]